MLISLRTSLVLTALLVLSSGCSSEEEPASEEPSEEADAGRERLDARPSSNDDPIEEAEPGKPDASRVDATSAPATVTTYSDHVAPILARSCVPCHSEGQIAPFSLENYERAQTFASLVAKVARARTMPPSVIDNSGTCNTFRDTPYLTDDEIETLEKWAAGGAQQGDANKPVPAKRELPKLSGDIKTIKTPSYVPSTERKDDYRCFVIDSPLTEKGFLTGFDTRPGNKKVAHHMVVFYPLDDGAGLLAPLVDALEDGPGYTCFGGPSVPATVIAAWAPGGGATLFPEGLGMEVAPGRPLIVQMHYNTFGGGDKPEADSTEIDLQFVKDSVAPAALLPMLDLDMNLPPGEKSVKEVVETSFAKRISGRTEPLEVYGVFPHMHELGKNLQVTFGDGEDEQCMLDAPRYSFHWQRIYFLDKPITVGADAPIRIKCDFDTTPRTEVTKWGEGTQDEMCVAGIFVKL